MRLPKNIVRKAGWIDNTDTSSVPANTSGKKFTRALTVGGTKKRGRWRVKDRWEEKRHQKNRKIILPLDQAEKLERPTP